MRVLESSGKPIMKVSIVWVPQDSEKCLAHFMLRCTTKEILLGGVCMLLGSFKKRKDVTGNSTT